MRQLGLKVLIGAIPAACVFLLFWAVGLTDRVGAAVRLSGDSDRNVVAVSELAPAEADRREAAAARAVGERRIQLELAPQLRKRSVSAAPTKVVRHVQRRAATPPARPATVNRPRVPGNPKASPRRKPTVNTAPPTRRPAAPKLSPKPAPPSAAPAAPAPASPAPAPPPPPTAPLPPVPPVPPLPPVPVPLPDPQPLPPSVTEPVSEVSKELLEPVVESAPLLPR